MKFKIRTDLAVELKEEIDGKNVVMKDVKVDEEYEYDGRVKVTKVKIGKENRGEFYGKQPGTYITIESSELCEQDEGYHREISLLLAKYIKELLPKKEKLRILNVGLGNREATPDSLGPRVIDNILITRNMNEMYQSERLLKLVGDYEISGLTPGVMAQTGMESAEVVRGVVREIKPDVIIVIDSLAARNTMRLNTTIQISDTGINPGSGVGNHRKGITKETVGVPVIAIGIPTVVDAVTIVNDTFENLIDIFSFSDKFSSLAKILSSLNPDEKYQLIKEIVDRRIAEMYVTPKDVDETIKYISYTISEGLNILWSENI